METLTQVQDYAKAIIAKYPDYKTNPVAAKEVASHLDFSHVTIKNTWESNWVYFYCDQSPTRVWDLLVFDKSMLPHLQPVLNIALNNVY